MLDGPNVNGYYFDLVDLYLATNRANEAEIALEKTLHAYSIRLNRYTEKRTEIYGKKGQGLRNLPSSPATL